MDRQFTTKHDLMRAFANAMNLVDPLVQHHHDFRLCSNWG